MVMPRVQPKKIYISSPRVFEWWNGKIALNLAYVLQLGLLFKEKGETILG
jgi:hypothetical protein